MSGLANLRDRLDDDLASVAIMGEPARAAARDDVRPTTRLEPIEIRRLLDSEPAAADDDVDWSSVPTRVGQMPASSGSLPAFTERAVLRTSRARVVMRALVPPVRLPWLELSFALVATAWIAARLLGA
jgi:hypothetical protein